MNNQTSTTDNRHNGWTNYETWIVNLMITNEQGSYDYWLLAAAEHRGAAPEATQVTDGIWTVEQAAKFNLAEQLKQEIEEGSPIKETSMYADLLITALANVDWSEIAEDLLQENEP